MALVEARPMQDQDQTQTPADETETGHEKPEQVTHEDVVQYDREIRSYPRYYATGGESVPTAYYRVEGPNGPVSHSDPDGRVVPTTMVDFVLDSQSDMFKNIPREETPWGSQVD